MRLRDDVSVKKAGDDYFIVPYSSAQAYHVRGAGLNEFGAFLAQQMECEITERALIELASVHTGEKADDIADDVRSFTQSLAGTGLMSDDFSYAEPSDNAVYLEMAGIRIIFNEGEKYLRDEILSFKCDSFSDDDCDLFVSFGQEDDDFTEYHQQVYMNDVACLYENHDDYVLCYSELETIRWIKISKDYKEAVLCLGSDDIEPTEAVKDEIYLALRPVFLLAALKDRKIALHCCACLDQYGAFLISGHSGAGKTTLSELIKESADITVINGDLGLLGTENGKAYIYGIPWCGTSGIYTVLKNALSSVTFIKKSDDNIIEKLDAGHDSMDFMNRIITPVWNERMLDARLMSGEMILRTIPLYRYYFRKEKEAGKIFYERRIADNTSVQ